MSVSAATTTAPAPTARRIASLALPALVVLAAEPIYVLVDLAVVGHLGRIPLASVAIGGSVMSVVSALGNFLAFGTTGRAARLFGAGRRAEAIAQGVQASWLALGLGTAVVVVAQLFAGPVATGLAGAGPEAAHVAAGAEAWLRIASFGIPGILLTLAGNGWMRGIQDAKRPLYYIVGPNALSAVLAPLLVYPLELGLVGSAVANVVAQTGSAALFVRALLAERVPLRPRVSELAAHLVVGRDLVLRTASIQVCFTSAAAVAARFGAAALGAHQVALQLWMFMSLALDAVAIAAQSLVGASLGAGHQDAARVAARRVAVAGGVCGLVFGVAIGMGVTVIPQVFTADPAVHAQARVVWPYLAAMQPVAGVVFALDGVLIGAGDVRYLRNLTLLATLGAFLPAIWLAHAWDLGLGGIWVGLASFVVVRLVGMIARLAKGRWAVVGATR